MRLRNVVITVALVAGLLLIGYLDKQAVNDERREYCAMVAEGLWPDYANNYAAECQATHGERKPWKSALTN